MSDNVIKFKRPKKRKPKRPMPPWLRRVLTLVAVVAALALAWGYFSVSGYAPG